MFSVSSLLPHAILGAFRSKSSAPILYTVGKVKLVMTGAATTAAMASALGGWWALHDEDRAAFVNACAARFDRPAALACRPPAAAKAATDLSAAAGACLDPFAVDFSSGGGSIPCARSNAVAAAPPACEAAPAPPSLATVSTRAACGCILEAARGMSDGDVDVVRAFRARFDAPEFARRDSLGFPPPLSASFIDRAGGAAAGMAAAYFDGVARTCGLRGF